MIYSLSHDDKAFTVPLFGFGFFSSAVALSYVGGVREGDRRVAGSLAGLISMFAMLGGLTIQLAIGFLLEWFAREPMSVKRLFEISLPFHASLTEYHYAFVILPCCHLLAMGVVILCRFQAKAKSVAESVSVG